jgi:hypothetical protein
MDETKHAVIYFDADTGMQFMLVNLRR